MNHPGLKKNKGGARPGAGRKSLGDERRAVYLASLGVEEWIKALEKKGEYTDLEREIRLEGAAKFAIKAIPQKFDDETMPRQIITIVRADGSQAQTV